MAIDAGVITGTGVTWYVSTTGSDTNTGLSLTAPFRNIAKGLTMVSAGDVIEVRAGTYSENLIVRQPGLPNAWILMRGYQQERPVLRGTSSEPTVYFYHSDCDESVIGSGSGNVDCMPYYWILQNLEIQGSATGGGDGNAVKIDVPKVKLLSNKLCCSVADVVKLVRTANDVEIRGNEIWQNSAVTTPSANAQGVDIVGADRTWVADNLLHDIPDIGI